MSKNRIQYTDDFVLKNEKVGINTSDPQETLHVDGNIRSDNSNFTGDATLNEFSGFQQDIQKISDDTTLTVITRGSYNSISSELVIEDGVELTVSDDVEVSLGRVETLTVNNNLKVPSSGTEDREDTPEKGSTRFNQDLGQLEFYTGTEWRTVNSYADSGGRGRGIFSGSNQGANSAIEFVTISSLGNSQEFGDSSTTHPLHDRATTASSSTRGLFVGGRIRTPTLSNTNSIGYITISSSGNTIDFGDLTVARRMMMGVSSSTRGVFGGGYDPTQNTIDYVEISTLGNALDFGDLTFANQSPGSFSSPTRGVWGGGYSPSRRNEITQVTISSKGNAVDFGKLTQSRAFLGGCSNSIRGIFAGGDPSPFNVIDYITISTGGNAEIFGDLTLSRNGQYSCSSHTRGLIGGGGTPSGVNIIDYVQISTTGDAQDFGDLSNCVGRFIISLSDSHGGLGGF